MVLSSDAPAYVWLRGLLWRLFFWYVNAMDVVSLSLSRKQPRLTEDERACLAVGLCLVLLLRLGLYPCPDGTLENFWMADPWLPDGLREVFW